VEGNEHAKRMGLDMFLGLKTQKIIIAKNNDYIDINVSCRAWPRESKAWRAIQLSSEKSPIEREIHGDT
jgi:hypothetical protein